MGMFDTVYYTCPNCGERTSTQTKAGECGLYEYDEYTISDEIAISFIKYGVPHPCEHCGITPQFRRPPLGVFTKPQKEEIIDDMD